MSLSDDVPFGNTIQAVTQLHFERTIEIAACEMRRGRVHFSHDD